MKYKALPIPEKLITEVLTDQIQMEDMLQLKDTLCDLIAVLSNKKSSSAST